MSKQRTRRLGLVTFGVRCVKHGFALVAVPDSGDGFIAKCPFVDCPNGIRRFQVGLGAYYDTDQGVVLDE